MPPTVTIWFRTGRTSKYVGPGDPRKGTSPTRPSSPLVPTGTQCRTSLLPVSVSVYPVLFRTVYPEPVCLRVTPVRKGSVDQSLEVSERTPSPRQRPWTSRTSLCSLLRRSVSGTHPPVTTASSLPRSAVESLGSHPKRGDPRPRYRPSWDSVHPSLLDDRG